MYKVFFAEDETAVRKAIIDTIDWESVGMTICGEAGNGEYALRRIIELKPDVLITDIKMPFMDGIELSRLVKMELPDILILILSGYDEFDLTHRAIRIGVFDYILKPVTPIKLLQALSRAGERIEQNNDEKRKQVIISQKSEKGSDEFSDDFKVEQIVNRFEISDFLKTASNNEIEGFAHRQAEIIWQAAHDSRLIFMCCLYDVFATACDSAGVLGIEMPPTQSFAQMESLINSQQELQQQIIILFKRIISAREDMSNSKSRLVFKAKSYIDNNYGNPSLSLSLVASNVGVAPNYLSSLINKETGESFSDYLNKVRIKRAMELIKSDYEPLSVIAQKVGYNDQYYLSKTFKKVMGISPREYKKM